MVCDRIVVLGVCTWLTACGAAESSVDAGALVPGSDAAVAVGADAAPDAGNLTATCKAWVASQRGTDVRQLSPASNQKQRDDMLAAGGGIRKLEDTYYTMWFPEGWYDQPVRRIMFTLHGTHGAPEFEWNDWKDHFARRNWGFIGLNYLVDESAGEAGYLEPDAIYKHLQQILEEMKSPCGVDKAALSMMGWSRGSIQGIRLLVLDRADKKLLLGHLANSAAWGTNDANMPAELVAIKNGGNASALAGANFWMYCGEQDVDEAGKSRCLGMQRAQDFLSSYGSHIEALYKNPGPGADHHSMPKTQAAVDQAFSYFESLR